MLKYPSLILSLLACIVAVHGVVPQIACAQSSKMIIASCPKEGWPPYLVTDDPGRPASGIMFDVLREAAQATGRQLNVLQFPEKRGIMLFRNGHVDAYPKAKEWIDSPDDFFWSDPIIDSVDVFITRTGACLGYKAPQDIFGKNIAMVRGFHYPKLTPHFENGAIIRHDADTTEAMLRMVQSGRVDGAITNRDVADWIIKQSVHLQADQLQFCDPPLDSAPYRFAFRKTPEWKRFIGEFNAELARMKEDGRFETILNRYR